MASFFQQFEKYLNKQPFPCAVKRVRAEPQIEIKPKKELKPIPVETAIKPNQEIKSIETSINPDLKDSEQVIDAGIKPVEQVKAVSAQLQTSNEVNLSNQKQDKFLARIYSETLDLRANVYESGVYFDDDVYYSPDEITEFKKVKDNPEMIKAVHNSKKILVGCKVDSCNLKQENIESQKTIPIDAVFNPEQVIDNKPKDVKPKVSLLEYWQNVLAWHVKGCKYICQAGLECKTANGYRHLIEKSKESN
jgi:hypothetical protein